MIQYHKAKITKGRFFSDKKLFRERVSVLPDGDYLLLLIKQSDKTPREFQNHYFAVIGEWGNDFGWSKSEVHNLVKEELFTELFDEEISTADLSLDQWQLVFLNLENFLILKFENS